MENLGFISAFLAAFFAFGLAWRTKKFFKKAIIAPKKDLRSMETTFAFGIVAISFAIVPPNLPVDPAKN